MSIYIIYEEGTKYIHLFRDLPHIHGRKRQIDDKFHSNKNNTYT